MQKMYSPHRLEYYRNKRRDESRRRYRTQIIDLHRREDERLSRRRKYEDDDYDYYDRRRKYPNMREHREIYLSSDEDSVEIIERKHCRSRCKHKSQPKELCDMKYYYNAAVKYFYGRRFDKALNYINIALKLAPDKDELRCKLYEIRGKCYSKLERPKCSYKAVCDWEKAYSLDPNNEHVKKNLSEVLFMAANKYYHMKQFKNAIVTAEKALNLSKENHKASTLLEYLKRKHPEILLGSERRKKSTTKKIRGNSKYEDESMKEPKIDDTKFFMDLAEKEFELRNFARALIYVNKALRMCRPDNEIMMCKLHEMKAEIVFYMKEYKIAATPVELPESDKCESSTHLDSLTPTMAIPEILRGLQSADPRVRCTAAVNSRKLLSGEESPPVDIFVTAGVIPHLVSSLACTNNIPLQFEACRALDKILSGTSAQTRAVVEAGAIPVFINLISSPHMKLVEQVIFALREIIGNCPEEKYLVIDHGIVSPLLSALTPHISTSLRRTITWILSTLCESKTHKKILKECIPAFAVLICHSDPETVTEACWGISYLTEETEMVQKLIDCGALPRLVELLQKTDDSFKPAIKCINNVVAGEDSQTQAAIDAGLLASLKKLITQDNVDVVEESIWTISYITAGNNEQIQAVINAGIMEHVIKVLNQGDYKCKKNAVWAVRNLRFAGTMQQILHLVQMGIIPPVCNLLSLTDPCMLIMLLDILNMILSAAFKMDILESACSFMEHCGGLSKIENLQWHENGEVYKAAFGIVNAYFDDEDNDNGEQDEISSFQIAENNTTFTFAEPVPAP